MSRKATRSTPTRVAEASAVVPAGQEEATIESAEECPGECASSRVYTTSGIAGRACVAFENAGEGEGLPLLHRPNIVARAQRLETIGFWLTPRSMSSAVIGPGPHSPRRPSVDASGPPCRRCRRCRWPHLSRPASISAASDQEGREIRSVPATSSMRTPGGRPETAWDRPRVLVLAEHGPDGARKAASPDRGNGSNWAFGTLMRARSSTPSNATTTPSCSAPSTVSIVGRGTPSTTCALVATRSSATTKPLPSLVRRMPDATDPHGRGSESIALGSGEAVGLRRIARVWGRVEGRTLGWIGRGCSTISPSPHPAMAITKASSRRRAALLGQ